MHWKSAVRTLLRILFYFGIANLPVWIASREFGFPLHGPFFLEVLLIGIVALWTSRHWLNSLVPLAIVVAILYNIKAAYLMSVEELWESASSVPLYAREHPGQIFAVVLAALLSVAFLFALDLGGDRMERRQSAGLLLALLVLMLATDAYRGTIVFLESRAGLQTENRLINNFSHRMLREVRAAWSKDPEDRDAPMAGATTTVAGRDLGGGALSAIQARPDIVLVLVESWGQPLDNQLGDALKAPYTRQGLESFYDIRSGTVPFRGPTVAGEARELCASQLGLRVIAAQPSQLPHCLPEVLQQRGYHTTAVHGFKPRMFQRESWYPRIGFEESWFLPQLRSQGLPECPGPFPGLCDAAVATWIGAKLRSPETSPQFVYWLTLNSHLPVPVKTGLQQPASCEVSLLLKDRALCTWFQLIHNVHRSVAQLALDQMAVRPTVFLIVGDHAPPFSSDARRGAFLSHEVPYVVLWPRALSVGQTDPQPGPPAPELERPRSAKRALALASVERKSGQPRIRYGTVSGRARR